MPTKMISFRIPEDLATELDTVATEEGKTISEFVRDLVDARLYPSKGSQPTLLKGKDFSVDTEELLGNVATLNEEVDKYDEKLTDLTKRFDVLQQDVDRRIIEAHGDISDVDTKAYNLKDKCEGLEKWMNRIIEEFKTIMAGYDGKLLKLHICPECGKSLHVHKIREPSSKTMEGKLIEDKGAWHLECIHCGFYTTNYQYPKWKEAGVDIFNPPKK